MEILIVELTCGDVGILRHHIAGAANEQDAQDAGVSCFEHILVCTNSMAEATVQTLPVRNCVVCSIALFKLL